MKIPLDDIPEIRKHRPQVMAVWVFPESDFAAWKNHMNGDDNTYADYLEFISSAARAAEQRGMVVRKVYLGVQEVLDELEKRNMKNDPPDRSYLFALLSHEKR